MNSKTRKAKLLTSITIAAFFSSTLFIFGPSHIFLSNASELAFLYSEIFPYLLLAFVVIALTLWSVLMISPPSVYQRLGSLFLGLGILLWMQGNLFLLDIGPLDGSDINWNNYKLHAVIDISIWILILVFSLLKSASVIKIAKFTGLAFILISTLSLGINYLNSEVPSREYEIDETPKFYFSSRKNVIIILLDQFQSDITYELLQNNAKLKDHFDGFVYFPDSTAGYSFTRASIPLILTGKYFDNSEPYSTYIENSYLGNSIPKVLKDHGFRVDLFPKFEPGTIHYHQDVLSNLKVKNNISDLFSAVQLWDIALFRCVPTFFKKRIYNNNNWLFSTFVPVPQRKYVHINWNDSDRSFVDEMLMSAKVIDSVPTFKFYHLFGAHVPYHLDSEGNAVGHKNTRESYKNIVHYKLKLTSLFLQSLKDNKLYDNSLIIICGDHGSGTSKDTRLGFQTAGTSYNEKMSTVPDLVKARAVTFLLVKNFNSRGKLLTSKKAMSLSNLPELIFDKLQINVENPEPIKPTDNRNQRRFLFYEHGGSVNYLPPLYEYIIRGNAWLDSSWAPPTRILRPRESYELIKTIYFGSKKSSSNLSTDGWGSEDDYYHWLGQTKSSISLSLDESAADLILRVNFYLAKGIKEKTIKIYIDDKEIGSWTIKNYLKHSPLIRGIKIPKGFRPGNFRIDFEVEGGHGVASPSIGIKSMSLYKKTG